MIFTVAIYNFFQENGRGMFTDPSTGYHYEGTSSLHRESDLFT